MPTKADPRTFYVSKCIGGWTVPPPWVTEFDFRKWMWIEVVFLDFLEILILEGRIRVTDGASAMLERIN